MTKRSAIPLAHLENVKQKKGETLKSYINHFNEMRNFVTWSPDTKVLAHLINGVLPETLLWGELQQKKCRSVNEFYKKAKKSGSVENKDLFPKCTNYHSLTTPLDHIYAVMERGLYRSLEPMKGNRARRDAKRNCDFHKDIGHNIDMCMALKDKFERLIRAGHFKEFVDEPQLMNKEERPQLRSPENF